MRKILLSQEQFALIDDKNFQRINNHRWYADWSEDTQSFYAVRYEGEWGHKNKIYMHREIMETSKGMICDHQNHDTLNNQEYNLRNITRSQNQMNRKIQSNNKLGEKCISPNRKGFSVHIMKSGKLVYNKWFKNLDDAIVARDEAIIIHHGEFAYIGNNE